MSNSQQFNQLVSFIWSIANDALVNVYNKGDYRKVILPMIVLRRFDAVLEPTKEAVLSMKKNLTDAGVLNQTPALCTVAGQAFCNSSPFTLKMLKSRTNSQQLKLDFIAYLDGFSENIQDVITKFKFRNEIDTLVEGGVLGILIEKFVDNRINLSNKPVLDDNGEVKLPALDNHTIGTVFEELLRKFNEENNVTEAGEHFTPRDIVTMMADFAFVPIMDRILDATYLIYDAACGTGGILSVSEQRIQELAKIHGKHIVTHIYGQELQSETYATCKSDLLIKGDGEEAKNISFGSTISENGNPGVSFDFCISNPPFGTPWRRDLENWGFSNKDDITDNRFVVNYDGKSDFSFVPNIGDPQMLFLANNVSRMKNTTELGTRIVEVHNGSSLFTGNAGGGESNLRRYIIEKDLLEAIVALPENMFYNTGIGTFIWIMTNQKEDRRKGKVQLIDATSIKTPLRKNLGEKNCEISPENSKTIVKLLTSFENNEQSKIFANAEFGYWQITVDRPLRLRIKDDYDLTQGTLREAEITLCKEALAAVPAHTPLNDWNVFAEALRLRAALLRKLRPLITDIDPTAMIVNGEVDTALRDTEQVPLLYEGGIDAFMKNEVLPYAPDAFIDDTKTVIGYELSFTKYFYKPVKLRSREAIASEILELEAQTDGLLNEILKD